MSRLARYTGPLRPFRGAIGWLADGGAVIAGRLVRGRTVAPCVVASGDGHAVTFASWEAGATALAAWLEHVDAVAAGGVLEADESPGGLCVAVDGVEYRLTVV